MLYIIQRYSSIVVCSESMGLSKVFVYPGLLYCPCCIELHRAARPVMRAVFLEGGPLNASAEIICPGVTIMNIDCASGLSVICHYPCSRSSIQSTVALAYSRATPSRCGISDTTCSIVTFSADLSKTSLNIFSPLGMVIVTVPYTDWLLRIAIFGSKCAM